MPQAGPEEDALIARLAGLLPAARRTRLGIGDDAAVVELPGGDLLLITTDLLMEDVHFRLHWGEFAQLGWKALAQNLSDIAAMGGAPTHAVIALGLPPRVSTDQAAALYRGIGALAAQSGVDIVGGDTIRSSGPLTLGVTVLGRVAASELLTRGGGHPGDALFVTGALGAAAAGVRLLDSGRPVPEALRPALLAQLQPQPRLTPARALATAGRVTAMMDLSDGVATDLHRLCRMSGTGAVVYRDRLPIAPVVPAACAWLAEGGVPCNSFELALCGGEDFELLLAAPPEAEDALRARTAPLPLTRIGELTSSPDLLLRDARDTPLPWGFTHF
ncbi:MAG: thiamine-phosphate kinase [Armatimonadota bacterium]